MTSDYSTDDIASKFTDWKTTSKLVKYIEEPNILKLVGDLTGKTVIDYGCGTGYYTRALASRALKVIGVDMSDHMISIAQKQSDVKNVEYKISDCSNVLECGEHDVALSVYFLSYATNEQMLKNILVSMFHSLKPGGVCCGLTFNHKILDFENKRAYNSTAKRVRNDTTQIDELIITFYSENTGEKMVELKQYLLHVDTVEQVFKQAGFVNFKWVQLEVPAEHEEHKHHFDEYFNNKATLLYWAEKPNFY